MARTRPSRKSNHNRRSSPAGRAGEQADGTSPAYRSSRSLTVFLAAAALGAVADLLTKHWVFAALAEQGQAKTIVTGFLRLRLVWNEGIVFGIRLPGALVLITTAAAVAVVIALFATSARGLWGLHLGLGMVLGGALGNAWDRAWFGAVRDFVDVHLPVIDYDYPTFNVADALLVVGVTAIILHLLRHRRRQAA